MSAPRLEIRLDHLGHNTRSLVQRLGDRGIGVTGVTKATRGSPEIARVLLNAGVTGLGDSRIENLEALRAAGIDATLTMIRSPMVSQAARVVRSADVSLNTELAVLAQLSHAAVAQGRDHGVVLMVELGDLREGILPADLPDILASCLQLPGLTVRGIGTNLACQSGIAPDERNMAELTDLAVALEARFGIELALVSGGNSATLGWALGTPAIGRVNDLRLGESILLGRDPLDRSPIEGLHTHVFTLVAEVIEAKVKPTRPWGVVHQAAFGAVAAVADRGVALRLVLAIGRQDVDPAGLVPPPAMTILGASSDHLVVDAGPNTVAVGSEIRFGLDYAALLRVMTSPYVARSYVDAALLTERD